MLGNQQPRTVWVKVQRPFREEVGEIRNRKQPMKYIVYLTTNLKNGKIYVGVHKTKTPHKFDGYIGNGVYIPKNNKNFKVKQANTPFKKAINKHGLSNFYRVTLSIFDDEEKAYELEKQIVTLDFIKSKHTYNVKLGGLHASSTNQRAVYQYDINGNYLAGFSSITAAAEKFNISPATILDSITERSITAATYVWRYYKKDKIDVRRRVPSNKGDTNAVGVVQYSKAGYKKKTFKSAADAGKHCNISPSSIVACCRYHDKNRSAGGYQWRYETDKIQKLDPLDSKTTAKPIQQILDGNVIKEFISSSKAGEAIGSKRFARGIRKACITGKLYKGFYWKFKVEDMV